MKGGIRVCKIILLGFCLLYALALLVWAMGTFGWFGTEKDPLSGVFLIILGQPWARWVDVLPEAIWPLGGILAPAINASILFAICRLLGRG
jgi:hypothetical protein